MTELTIGSLLVLVYVLTVLLAWHDGREDHPE